MATVRVDIDDRAVTDLLRGGEVRGDLERRGRAIVTAAGAGYRSETWRGRRRWRVTVRSADRVIVARSPLVRALSAGRR